MTPEIAWLLVIMGVAFVLLLTEWLRADVVAVMVLLALTLTGLIEPPQAVSGFSSSAVIAVCGILVMGMGLQRAGLATWLGNLLVHLGGRGEIRIITAIMATSALLSFFMNTLAIVAILLPAVMDLARRTGVAPSRVLMPLAFGSLLGGLTTLFATLPNLLASAALRSHDLEPFGLFDFLPVGTAATVLGIAFVALVGRHLLPVRDLQKETATGRGVNLKEHYRLNERMFVLRIPPSCVLNGKTIEESRLGSALGLHVVGILREGRTQLSPHRSTRLLAHDRLLVQGQPSQLENLETWRHLRLLPDETGLENWFPEGIAFAEVRLAPGSRFDHHTIAWLDVRRRGGVNVLAVRRGEQMRWSNLSHWELQTGDALLLQGPGFRIDAFRDMAGLEGFRQLSPDELARDYHLADRLFTLLVPGDSALCGRTLEQSRLGEALGLTVLGIARGQDKILMPGSQEVLQAQDRLLVEGRREDLHLLQGIHDLQLEREVAPELSEFESENFGLVEVVLSPRASLVGKSLKQVRFRERFGLSVLGLWRAGDTIDANLANLPLAFGDALLAYGPQEKLRLLAQEPDFIVLTRAVQKAARPEKAPAAGLAMLLFLVPVAAGWLPIHIAALLGAVLMILLGCIRVDEAYQAIELKAVVLIAGMMPLSLALEQTGAAQNAAASLAGFLEGYGPLSVLAAVFIITALMTCVLPGTAVVVLLAPIVLQTAQQAGMSPQAAIMSMAMAASGGFLSPVAHPSNVLIMGPGAYRFRDFLRLGIPITLLVLIVVLLVVPLFWHLHAP